MSSVEWMKIFMPDTPVLEIVVRGSVMYLALFMMLRFILRRETGSLGITDLLVIVLIADAAQNGMAGSYHTITDGLILVATIIGWSYLLNWLAFRYPTWRKIIQAPRVQLVRDGRILRRNLEQEKITEEELLAEIHAHGCEDVRSVRAAWIEPDGMVSVIQYSGGGEGPGRKKRGI
jgi:uncharacterized membrane protein YcaP (DUF421 family)